MNNQVRNLGLALVVSLAVSRNSVAAVPDTTEGRERQITDVFVQTYAATDWSAVIARMEAQPSDPTNPNIMVAPLSLGNGYLGRYETGHDLADFERALSWFEWVGAHYSLWGQRWLTPAVAQYLDISVLRMRIQPDAWAYRVASRRSGTSPRTSQNRKPTHGSEPTFPTGIRRAPAVRIRMTHRPRATRRARKTRGKR